MPETNSSTGRPQVALIGFGEAGEAFARAGRWHGHCRGWDIKADRRALMAECGVGTAEDAARALADAGIAIGLVTTGAAIAAADTCAPLLPAGAIWCDMNSVSPDTKRQAAARVEAAGGRYVDVAVMGPVDDELAVPLLVSGKYASAALDLLSALGFANVRSVGDEVGRAAAIKLIRSVMVKGIEALSEECASAAEAAGVWDEVIASLDSTDRSDSWAKRIAYNRGRMSLHGHRRAAEMRETAATLEGLGVEPVMTRASVEVHCRTAARASLAGDDGA